MRDRKTDSIVTRIAELKQNLEDVKGEQFVGADNTEIKRYMMSNVGVWDLDFALLDSQRAYTSAVYAPPAMSDWLLSSFNEIRVVIYAGNDSDPSSVLPYTGDHVDAYGEDQTDASQAICRIQFFNRSGVTKRIKIKYFIYTTNPGGGAGAGVSFGDD